MATDASIPLQGVQPNPTNFISGFLDLGQKRLNLDKARATFDADVAQRQADSSSAQSAATVNAANVNPLIQQQQAHTSSAQTASQLAKYRLTGEQSQKALDIATGLVADPSFVKADSDSMLDKLNMARDQMVAQGIDPKIADVNITTLKYQAIHNPGQVQQTLKNMILSGQNASGQGASIAPSGPVLSNGTSTQMFNTNPLAGGVGAVPGVGVQAQVPPTGQEEIQADAQGNRYVVQRSPQGVIVGTRQVPGSTTGGAAPAQQAPAGPVNLPPNETPQTRDALQSERQQALNQVQSAPQLRQLNREIYGIAEGDVQTGKLGGLINRVASATGYNLGAGDATDYNTLGKMLARANQQLSQSMGPHTNAGLEQTNAANGTVEYDKNTIKKIASLNDALLTGVQMYQQGLEKAIKQNGIFGKREFDQAWGSAMDPDVLQFKNAVDNKNQGQIDMAIKRAGGKGSSGAKTLFDKLTTIDSLATNGRP